MRTEGKSHNALINPNPNPNPHTVMLTIKFAFE